MPIKGKQQNQPEKFIPPQKIDHTTAMTPLKGQKSSKSMVQKMDYEEFTRQEFITAKAKLGSHSGFIVLDFPKKISPFFA